MRKFVLLILVFSMLMTGIECVAQKKQAIQALMGKGIIELHKVIKYNFNTQFTSPSVVDQWINHYNPYNPQIVNRQDSLSLLLDLVKVSNPTELLQCHQESMLQKEKVQLQGVYQKRCAEMERGKILSDTLAWARIGNKAVELGLDSVAVDCIARFLSYWPSTMKIAAAVDLLMNSSQLYAQSMVEIYTDYEFCKYWENSDSTKIGISDFEILVELGEKCMCCHTDLARGMLCYLDGNYDGASDLFMRAINYAIEFPHSMTECQNMLFCVTAYCMSMAERYSDMLTFFEKYEVLDQYAAKDPYTAFLLYRASLFSNPDKVKKYADMGLAANDKYFMEQFQELYSAVYADFIENPQPLTNLDFLFGGLDSIQLSQSYINIASELIGKLPDTDTSYDGVEHYYDEALSPYREALLEIAKRSDSLQNGRLTPDNALVKIIAESTSAGFSSSAEQGKTNVKTLFEQLYKKRDNPEYYVTIVMSGFCYSVGLSYQKPKEALKVMNKAVLPTMEKLDMQDVNPFGTEETVEIYKYMAGLYRRIGKPKKAEKMQKLANECVIVVE